MKLSRVKFENNKSKYSILIGKGVINKLKKEINMVCPDAEKIALIFDKKIPKKLKNKVKSQIKNFKVYSYEYTVNEKIKSFEKVVQLNESLLEKKFNRNDLMIAIGGGVIGDFGGFVASILKRGINFINLPSTLLSQVDASIGGKTE